MTLGQVMKQRRFDLKRTAAECAALAGMTPSEWSRWEASQSRRKDGKPSEPRSETFRAIAFALEWSAQELREMTGSDEVAPDVPTEWKRLWTDTPIEKRDGLLKATRSVKEAIAA